VNSTDWSRGVGDGRRGWGGAVAGAAAVRLVAIRSG
jgi:hypothetical protein